MQLISVNIAQPQTMQLGSQEVQTGIYKLPTDKPVRIHKGGLRGDTIGNQKDHGGPDQAVYLYSTADYAWWSHELQRELVPGAFGENLTLSSFGKQPPRVGDRLHIGEVVLELTAPRIPCARLATRMGDPKFVKQFTEARRPGAYARVLEEGTVQAGDEVRLTPAPDSPPSIVDFAVFWGSKHKRAEDIRRYLELPIAQRARDKFEDLLKKQAK